MLFYSYLALRNFFQQCKYKYRTNHVEAGAANNAFNYHYAIDAGGYNPEMMKGEDSDLCNKLRPYGQVTKVGAPVISSARRQIGEGLSQAIATRIYLNVHRMLIGEVDSPNTMDDYR